MPNRKDKQLGFTLIEILVALFIFAIISTMMTTVLHTLLSSQINTEKSSSRFSELEMALTLISQDMEQIINRPITTSNNNIENAVIGSDKHIAFTRAGFVNPGAEALRSTLQRVNYQLADHILVRTTWPALDQTSHTLSNKRLLLKNVKQLEFEYVDKNGNFQNRWPPAGQGNNDELPRAIRMTLTLKNLGKISQTYVVSGQKLEKSN